ncbi:MAG: exonuclease SbcCD subunit D [Chloroflexi bacterium]|nr:exonuclease SbcCD subunit D [Chloroflexota bacterium]
MAKLRLLHLADIHLGIERYGRVDPATGLNSRLLDFTASFDKAVDYALENEVDLVVFCGDAYRNRDPNPTYQREFARRIHRLARNGVRVFLLVGNHDLPLSAGRANAIDIFETLEVENVVIGRKPGLYDIETRHGGVQIVAIPWLARNQILSKEEHKDKTIAEINDIFGEYLARRIEDLAGRLDPQVPSILAAHFSVMGAVFGSEKSVMLGQDIVIPRSVVSNRAFDYVALGHVHKHQVIGNYPLVVYAGSLERIDFGEEGEEKGFVVVDLEKGAAEYRFQPVAARRFLTIEVSAEGDDPTEEILAAIGKQSLEGAIVRLFVKTTPDREPKINDGEVRRALKDAYCLATISRQVDRKTRKVIAGDLIEEMLPLEALELYLKAKQYAPERRKLLLEYADRLMGEGLNDSH